MCYPGESGTTHQVIWSSNASEPVPPMGTVCECRQMIADGKGGLTPIGSGRPA